MLGEKKIPRALNENKIDEYLWNWRKELFEKSKQHFLIDKLLILLKMA